MLQDRSQGGGGGGGAKRDKKHEPIYKNNSANQKLKLSIM
jgi:hypothetical protein